MTQPTAPRRDPFATPSDDPDERAESDWLVARDADPAAPPPSAEVADSYARLEGLLATLPAVREDASWQDAVLATVRVDAATTSAAGPRPRSRRRWIAATSGLVVAAAVIVVLVSSPSVADPELTVGTRRLVASRGAPDEVAVNDRLLVRARPRTPAALRVYRGLDTVLLLCPSPACASNAAVWDVEVPMSAKGEVYVILAFGAIDVSADAPMSTFIAAARRANARVIVHSTIYVR